MRRIAGIIVTLTVAAMLAFGTPRQTSPTVLDGVYTADQASKGEKDYETHCAKCHEGNDPEGPTLMGRTFIDRWREDNLDTLFDFMSTRMPADRAERLDDKTYLEILAFLLQANSYSSGARELDTDGLQHIRLIGKDGPRPLPANTLVKLVGCLTQESGGDWALTQAAEPVRSREGKETTPEELKKSAAKNLGSQTFKLQNFTNISFEFKPDAFKGHKVQVKGVLIRNANGERISLTALDSVAEACTR